MTPPLDGVYIVMAQGAGYLVAHFHRGSGQGRARRRQPMGLVRIPVTSDENLPSVLRALAAELDKPVGERWLPEPEGLGNPGGVVRGDA